MAILLSRVLYAALGPAALRGPTSFAADEETSCCRAEAPTSTDNHRQRPADADEGAVEGSMAQGLNTLAADDVFPTDCGESVWPEPAGY
ncbi:hypothetical protein N7532_010918 [Penicillium argentinense]|uniref:Secreted protein n=1 Tax=Penicillium argentinense TaxID=1131581 RepID=A0A9W9JZ07_9EURO|nr:uncharacterized protein N7532_010918 [Penicillium argentinense]KAJ5086147.1 hypothetical protein N7532_010918 [Penicillium argentinense]